jgi:hypothetical protein
MIITSATSQKWKKTTLLQIVILCSNTLLLQQWFAQILDMIPVRNWAQLRRNLKKIRRMRRIAECEKIRTRLLGWEFVKSLCSFMITCCLLFSKPFAYEDHEFPMFWALCNQRKNSVMKKFLCWRFTQTIHSFSWKYSDLIIKLRD